MRNNARLLCAFLQLWRKLFPRAEISFIEFDVQCAEKYRGAIEQDAGGTLYAGDQANKTLMAKVVADAQKEGLYDIIIDE